MRSSAHPVVVWANWVQFRPGEEFIHPRVESRLLVWCRRGSGRLTLDDREVPFPPGGFALLPWGARLHYRGARRQPFLLGGVHLIPRHDMPWEPVVAHGPGARLAGHAGRGDDAGLPRGLVCGTWSEHPALAQLAGHLAERWSMAVPDAVTAAAQGRLVFDGLSRLGRDAGDVGFPVALRRVLAAMQARPAADWSLDELASLGGCSRAWLVRLFNQHLRRPPHRHLAALRLERACALLADGDAPVAAVGAAVGIPDQARFAKVFRAAYGLPPTAWRRRRAGL